MTIVYLPLSLRLTCHILCVQVRWPNWCFLRLVWNFFHKKCPYYNMLLFPQMLPSSSRMPFNLFIPQLNRFSLIDPKQGMEETALVWSKTRDGSVHWSCLNVERVNSVIWLIIFTKVLSNRSTCNRFLQPVHGSYMEISLKSGTYHTHWTVRSLAIQVVSPVLHTIISVTSLLPLPSPPHEYPSPINNLLPYGLKINIFNLKINHYSLHIIHISIGTIFWK